MHLACLSNLTTSFAPLRASWRRPEFALAFGLACLSNFAQLARASELASELACLSMLESVEVGTFNIRYSNDGDGPNAWSKRSDLVVSILKDGDFWGLQEALPSQVEQIARALPEWKMIVRTREKDPALGEACPILYRADRWKPDPAACGTFWLSESPETAGSKSWDSSLPRICTYARFTSIPEGRALTVFNLHLDHQGTRARLESAKLVASRIAARSHPDEPFILVGDFNCGPSSEPVRHLLSDPKLGLQDAWRATHRNAAEQPTFNGWRERCEGERIDWILASPALVVERAEIDASKRDGRWPSDHAFIRARIRLPK